MPRSAETSRHGGSKRRSAATEPETRVRRGSRGGSAYGPGWKRENSFLTHAPGGAFCYGFYPHGGHGAGNGTRYRATVIGPGVTPDVMWQGPAPAQYDPAADAQANAAQRELLANDRRCVVN